MRCCGLVLILSMLSVWEAWTAVVNYETLTARVAACVQERVDLDVDFVTAPPSVDRVDRDDKTTFGAALRNVLAAQQIKQVEALKWCAETVAEVDGEEYEGVEGREFGDSNYGQGHRAVYLNPFLARVLPGVYARIYWAAQMVATKAGFRTEVLSSDGGRWRPALGIRCVEHLSYGQHGGLGWHDDSGSIYTLSIMLSSPQDYQGGVLLLNNDSQHDNSQGVCQREDKGCLEAFQDAKPGDGYMLRSMATHKVSAITQGRRKVLVLEFWPLPDATAPTRLNPTSEYPSPEGFGHPRASASTSPAFVKGNEDFPQYHVRQGSLNPGANVAQGHYTSNEAIELCDRLSSCVAFTYQHPKASWIGADGLREKLWIDFKGFAAFNFEEGVDGTQVPFWSAIKPWSKGSCNGNPARCRYRECEVWADTGQCARLPTFMERNCPAACEQNMSIGAWDVVLSFMNPNLSAHHSQRHADL